MSDDELEFDPTLKKKKPKNKKKKKALDFAFDETETDPAPADVDGDDAGAEADSAEPAAAAAAAADGADAAGDGLDDIDVDLDLEFGGKKKKKKNKKKDATSAEDDLAVDLGDLDLDAEFSKKKKKKKKPTGDAAEGGQAEEGEEQNAAEAWAHSDRDYTYDELLDRVFDIMRQKNPDMVAGEKRRFVMKPPQVVRVGAKKSSFVNFAEIAKLLRRMPDHLLGFILAELGTSGAVDGSNALVIKGRFTQKQIESVLKRYIREYVTCHTCKSPETILRKENRLFFLQCESCGSRCSVQSIKSGFQAVTGKRAAIRAAAN